GLQAVVEHQFLVAEGELHATVCRERQRFIVHWLRRWVCAGHGETGPSVRSGQGERQAAHQQTGSAYEISSGRIVMLHRYSALLERSWKELAECMAVPFYRQQRIRRVPSCASSFSPFPCQRA